MAANSEPVPTLVKAEATIEAWNDTGLPWPEFVAHVKANTNFPDPDWEEFPDHKKLIIEEAPDGTRKVLEECRGKLLIGTIDGKQPLLVRSMLPFAPWAQGMEAMKEG